MKKEPDLKNYRFVCDKGKNRIVRNVSHYQEGSHFSTWYQRRWVEVKKIDDSWVCLIDNLNYCAKCQEFGTDTSFHEVVRITLGWALYHNFLTGKMDKKTI